MKEFKNVESKLTRMVMNILNNIYLYISCTQRMKI